MVKNILIIGGNSDFAKAIIKNLNKDQYNIFLISRSQVNIDKVQTYVIKNYLDEIYKIEDITKKNNIDNVLIFNGLIFEGSEIRNLSKDEIVDTFFVNFVIPSSIINRLIQVNKKIRFSVISSIATAKLRNKNYYYGMSKQALEEYITNLRVGTYFIFRSGFIYTKLTEEHTAPPFSQDVQSVALEFIKEFLKKQIFSTSYAYSSRKIKALYLLFQFTPKQILNYIERKLV